jgi:hypothetical protein
MVKFERLIHLTESFTWEELPTKDPVTGRRTWAGLITGIQKVSKNVFLFTVVYHVIQTSVSMVTSNDMVFNAWYPFDVSTTPVYELIILSQVRQHACGFVTELGGVKIFYLIKSYFKVL